MVSGTILLSGKHDTEPQAPEKWLLTPFPRPPDTIPPPPALPGLSHGTAVYGPIRTVVWEG